MAFRARLHSSLSRESVLHVLTCLGAGWWGGTEGCVQKGDYIYKPRGVSGEQPNLFTELLITLKFTYAYTLVPVVIIKTHLIISLAWHLEYLKSEVSFPYSST